MSAFAIFLWSQKKSSTLLASTPVGSPGSSAPSVDAGGQKAWRRAAEHTHRQEEAAGRRREKASGLLLAEAGLGKGRGASSARAWGRPGAVGGRRVTVMLVGVLGRRGGEGSFQVGGSGD